MKPLFYADIHSHSTMKPFHSGEPGHQKSLWEEFLKSDKCKDGLLDSFVKNMIKYSQADFTKSWDANMLLIFNSLYPIELPWFDMTGIGDLIVNKENQLRLAGCLTNFNQDILINRFMNVKDGVIPSGEAAALPVDYFPRLEKEYGYLAEQAKDPGNKFRILKDYEDYKAWKALFSLLPPQKEIAVIFCIEGAHSFLEFKNYQSMLGYTYDLVKDDQWADYAAFRDLVVANIDKVKRWGPDPAHEGQYAPLYITFSHHFWNLMSGHAASLGNCFLDQSEGQDERFTPLGKIAVGKLLEKGESGRRILIDIKHLCFFARNEFYDIRHSYARKGDPFPMIASHAAVTGTPSPDGDVHPVFNTCDINFYDWDIKQIKESEGLIGIMMEEGRLIRKDMMEQINKLCDGNPDKLSQKLAEIVLAQALHIVEVCPGTSGWDIICSGSDYDGMINSLDAFDTVRKTPVLFDNIHYLLKNELPVLNLDYNTDDTKPPDIHPLYTSADVRRLKGGLSADAIIEKLSYKNVERFLEKFFNDGYLKSAPAAGNIT
ncbi:MAG: membrane dipeptidase [Bacteroidetes bacterium]|nr:membrane dipeptidase [Bacteroidota bacterium]